MSLLLIPPPPPLTPAEIPALPPTQDDLPYDDGIPMETPRHQFQMALLIETLDRWLEARGDGFTGGNMFLYYSLAQVSDNPFVGPDFFVALDVPRGERKSWVVWEQGKGPDLVLELLSTSTARYDKTAKKTLYARQIHVPEYYWYDPFNPEDFAGFILHGGDYQPLAADSQDRLHSPALNLSLGRWTGTYRGVTTTWLRWFTPDDALLPTAAEAAQQQAEAAQQRAERLAERLRRLGVDPDAP